MRRDQGIKCKNAETPLRRTKARTIQDMLRANAMTEGEDDADNPEEDCSAPECIINKITVKSINWVQCEICSEWYHIYCVTQDENQTEMDIFTRYSCSNAL